MTICNPQNDSIQLIGKMIKDGQLSRTLYTYMPIDCSDNRVRLIFEECKLRFSSPASFNDPFDCKIYPTIPSDEKLAKYLAAQCENVTNDSNTIFESLRNNSPDTIVRKAIEKIMNEIGVKCFTPNNANILMWSHYAKSHTGICLEFDILSDPAFFVCPIKIVYSDDYPQLEYTGKNFVTKLLQTKSKVWEYEQEVRVYKPQSNNYTFNPIALKSVTFGCNTSNPQQLIDTIRNNKDLQHVNFFQCKTNPKQFKLDIVPYKNSSL